MAIGAYPSAVPGRLAPDQTTDRAGPTYANECIADMNRRELLGATAIIGYWIAGVLGHLKVSLWLVRQRESAPLGSRAVPPP